MSELTPETPDTEPTDFVGKVEDAAADVATEAEHVVEEVAAEVPTAEEVVAEVEKVAPLVEDFVPQSKPVIVEGEHYVSLLEHLAESFRQHAVAVEKVLGEFINKTGFKN